MSCPCTILIPTKDRPALLRRSVASALVAAPEDGEVLVVDDTSAQPAAEVLQGETDPRLRVIVNPGKGGVSNVRNHGVEEAKGAVIFFLDDDDEILPFYCNYVLNRALTDAAAPDYGFAAYQKVVDDADGGGYHSARVGNAKLPEGIVAPSRPFKRRMSGFGIGFWIRADVFAELGPIDETLATNEDTEYSCRLMAAGKRAWFCLRPAVRLHDHSASSGGNLGHVTHRTTDAARAECFARIMDRHADWLARDDNARQHLAKRRIKLLVKAGDTAAARELCTQEKMPLAKIGLLAYCLAIRVVYGRNR